MQKHNHQRVNVSLDGEFAFGLARIVAAWLQEGQVISDEKIAQLREEDAREVAYQQALNLILQKSTSILIAHRLSTVKSADRIIVVDHGQIIEEGNHQTLLERGGHYAGFQHQPPAQPRRRGARNRGRRARQSGPPRHAVPAR